MIFLNRVSRKWLLKHVDVLEKEIFRLNREISALNYILGNTPKSLHPTDIYMAENGLYTVLERKGE